MPFTIDETIAQLQALREHHGGHLLVLGVQEVPVMDYRQADEGKVVTYAIRYFPDTCEGDRQ